MMLNVNPLFIILLELDNSITADQSATKHYNYDMMERLLLKTVIKVPKLPRHYCVRPYCSMAYCYAMND